MARAALEEPLITAILRQMESDACSLQGLDSRLKSEESLARKIQTDAAADGITEDEAAAKIADVLRYTLCIREDEYAATVKATLQKLTDAGCSVIKFKNTWGGFGYKVTSPSGFNFWELSLNVSPGIRYHFSDSWSIQALCRGFEFSHMSEPEVAGYPAELYKNKLGLNINTAMEFGLVYEF